MDDLELYNFYKAFNAKGLYYVGEDQMNQWYFETDGIRCPISRILLDDFAHAIARSVETAKEIVEKAKKYTIRSAIMGKEV